MPLGPCRPGGMHHDATECQCGGPQWSVAVTVTPSRNFSSPADSEVVHKVRVMFVFPAV